MKRAWKGALIGGVVGIILSIIFSFTNLGTSYCTSGLNLNNFLCSVSSTFKEFGLLSTIISAPKLFIINVFKLSEFEEILIFPILALIFFILFGGISYLIGLIKK